MTFCPTDALELEGVARATPSATPSRDRAEKGSGMTPEGVEGVEGVDPRRIIELRNNHWNPLLSRPHFTAGETNPLNPLNPLHLKRSR